MNVTVLKDPRVLIIGSQKSGTTSLAESIGTHPDVFVSEPREPEFLSRALNASEKEWRDYQSLFADKGESQLGLEASTGTMMSPETGALISERLPDAKLIAVLRHPVKRAYSGFVHSVKKGRAEYPSGTRDAFRDEAERYLAGDECQFDWFQRSEYHRQLKPFKKIFGDQLMIVIFEEMISQPSGILNQVQDFIGVEKKDLVLLQENQTMVPANSVATHLVQAGRKVVGPIRSRLNEKAYRDFRYRLMTLLGKRPKSLDAQLSSQLWDEKFAEEKAKMERLVGRSIDAWERN